MDDFFIRIDETELGPVSIVELKELVNEGSLTSDDLVWAEGLPEWQHAGQVEELVNIFPTNGNGKSGTPGRIIAVASGKGGVGKTVFSASLGVGLAAMGENVIMVDADLGGANLHTCLGILEPGHTLFDFFSLQKDSLGEIVLETQIENLKLISGSCGTLGMANPGYKEKKKFMQELRSLTADFLILDSGAGSSDDIIDFFLLANEQILVVTPEPTSLHEAFGFLKIATLRKMVHNLEDFPKAQTLVQKHAITHPSKMSFSMSELNNQVRAESKAASVVIDRVIRAFNPKIIINMVTGADDFREAIAIQTAANELLSIKVDILGYISYDEQVGHSVRSFQPFLIKNPKSKASRDMSTLIRAGLMGKRGLKELVEKHKWMKRVEAHAREQISPSLEGPICSVKCFYWDDCEYQNGGKPCQVRHLDPLFRN